MAACWAVVSAILIQVSLGERASAPHASNAIQCRPNKSGGWVAGELVGGKFTPLTHKARQLRERERKLLTSGDIVTARRTRGEREALTFRRALEDAYCNSEPQPSVQALSKKFSLRSSDFINRGEIPTASSCWQNGLKDSSSGLSPAISWRNTPPSATQLALVVSDSNTSLIHFSDTQTFPKEAAAGHRAKLPANGEYDPQHLGTMTGRHPIVQFLKERGWTWGGEWGNPLDYHHFQKVPRELEDEVKALRNS